MNALFSFVTALFVTITGVFSPTVVVPTPTPTPAQAYYQAKGETKKYPYRVRYVLWLPKGGGEVNGEIKGYVASGDNETCSAVFRGLYEGDTLTGDIKGTCTILFIEQDVVGSFKGSVNVEKKYVDGWVNGSVGTIGFFEYVSMKLYEAITAQ